MQTSTGVKETGVREPWAKLLLTKNSTKYMYFKKLLHNLKFVISRIEFTFYSDSLKDPM